MKTASTSAAKVCAAVILCAVACTTGPSNHDPAPPSPPAPRPLAAESAGAGTTLDLASVMRRAHFRFHPDGDGFVARQDTYGAHVSAAGVIEVAATRATAKPLVLTTLLPTDAHASTRDGGVAIARGRCVTEHARGTEGGVEQSWVFDCPPPPGELVVRVAASGPAFLSSDERGLLFHGGGGGDGNSAAIRYGAATWVDARGARTAVQPEYSNGTITLRVPEEVVRRSSFPATLDPLVGPEIALDKPVVVTTPSTQDHAAVAFNGTSYMVVWDDLRNGDWDIYGARVDPATGQVLSADANGVPIAVTASSQQLPSIATNGTDFFVVWQDTRETSTKIYGARVTGGGQVVAEDAGGFALGGGTFAQRSPDVAWDGTHYFVAWEDGRNPIPDVFGIRVGADGKPLAADANGIAINTAVSSAQTRPKVACSGTTCLVVWGDNRATGGASTVNVDVYGARVVSATGAVMDAEPTPLAIATGTASQSNPAIACDSVTGHFLVTWDDFTASAAPDIFGRRINGTTGASLDATPIAIATGAQSQRLSSVAFDGTRFLVAWTNVGPPNTTFGALIGGDGARITAAPEGIGLGSTTGLQSTATVAGGSAGFYVAWTELSGSTPSDVHGTRVDPTTAAARDTPSVTITAHANAELAPAVASDGTDYLVVWEDGRKAVPGDVYGARVLADGKVHPDDVDGVLIAEATTPGTSEPGFHIQPTVTFGAGTYLVAWTDCRAPNAAVYALRFDPKAGKPVAADGTGIRVSGDPGNPVVQTAPALGFAGGTFLAAWRDARNGPDNVYARTIKPLAALTLGDEVRIGVGLNASTAPSIASDGAQTFLIAWQDFRDGEQFLTYAARLDPTGKPKPGDAGGFPLSKVASNQLGPTAAWSGSEFFVAWEDHRTHGAAGEIFGRRIPLTGEPIGDDIAIAAGTGAEREAPAIVNAHDDAPGGNLEVVWRENRSGQWDVFGALVSASGLVREPNGLGIALEPGDKGPPVLAAKGNGEMIVAYSRLDPSAQFGVARARARILSTGLRTGACAKDDDCATRFCTDGACCDGRCDAPCRACGTGACTLVTSGQDDHCSGIDSCSATGQCQRANGQPCQLATECASGVCDRDDGVCCDRACDGECNTCKSKTQPGQCTALIAGTAPVNCVPFACDGKSDQCPTKCEGDIECARPNVCLPGGKCEPLTAATCIDDHTIKAPSGLVTDCKPYACAGSTCVSPCKSVMDCVGGFVCDVDGTCVQPPRPSDTGGCSCAATGAPAPSPANLAWLAGALLVVLRRARRVDRA